MTDPTPAPTPLDLAALRGWIEAGIRMDKEHALEVIARAESAEANRQKAERKATDLFDIGIREKKRAIAAEAKIAAVRELVVSDASPGASQDYSTGYEHALARIADALDGTA